MIKNLLVKASTTTRVGIVIFISLVVATSAYFVDHKLVYSTLDDYNDHKLIVSILVGALTAVVLHVLVPDA